MATASDLYEALHETVAAAVMDEESDLSTFEVLGALEQVKHDIATAADDDEDEEGEEG